MTKSFEHNTDERPMPVYKITVQGTVTENWKDWFNGMLIDMQHSFKDCPHTILTCQVRDQSELYGILNWLHNINLKLIEVTLTKP